MFFQKNKELATTADGMPVIEFENFGDKVKGTYLPAISMVGVLGLVSLITLPSIFALAILPVALGLSYALSTVVQKTNLMCAKNELDGIHCHAKTVQRKRRD